MENKINTPIPEELFTQTLEKINSAATDLKPYLIALTTDQRRKIPKMADGTEPFVDKALDYTSTNAEFTPPFMKADDFAIDLDTRNKTKQLINPLEQLLSDLTDTCLQAGSEAYVAALSYYNSVKQASKMSIAGSKPVYEDLKQRFEANGNRR